jgi:alpha-tubulin suppressor-like RCC1 family protein
MNRTINLNWDLTRNLRVDYMGRTLAVVDEPEGDLYTQAKRDSVRNNVRNFGRTTNYNHQINENYKIPLDKIGFTDWIGISGGSYHSIGLRSNGTVWSWGRNTYFGIPNPNPGGQLGTSDIINRSSPVSVVGGFTNWTKISAGRLHTLALRLAE